jgi:replicative superfamily II helicase
MQRFITLFLVSIVSLLLNGCGTSNLTYSHQQLHLQTDDTFVQTKGRLIHRAYDSYGSLSIEQKVLQLEDGMVVYEDAQTDMQYEFEKAASESIKVVFDAKRTYIIYAKNNLYAYQLLLTNGKILNVIAQQDDSQQLRMVYGMSSQVLDRMLKTLDPAAKGTYYKKVITLEKPENAIKSRWNVRKVHFYPLVSPLPKMMAM